MGQLCNNDCTAIFTKNDLQIFKNGKLLIKCIRNKKDRLWDVPFDLWTILPSKQSANVLVDLQQSKKDLASFYHDVLHGLVLWKGFFVN